MAEAETEHRTTKGDAEVARSGGKVTLKVGSAKIVFENHDQVLRAADNMREQAALLSTELASAIAEEEAIRENAYRDTRAADAIGRVEETGGFDARAQTPQPEQKRAEPAPLNEQASPAEGAGQPVAGSPSAPSAAEAAPAEAPAAPAEAPAEPESTDYGTGKYEDRSQAQLSALAKSRNLASSGSKDELIKRLRA